jgi:hypothetical protein
MQSKPSQEPNADEFDYVRWLERARQFAASCSKRLPGFSGKAPETGKAAAPGEIQATERQLGFQLPLEVSSFFCQAGRSVTFSYHWNVPEPVRSVMPYSSTLGGCLTGRLELELSRILGLQDQIKEVAAMPWPDEQKELQQFWDETIPLMALGNGDFLGVLRTSELGRSEVRYLAHDAGPEVLAASFPEFLAIWERLCYVGPEIWWLGPFIDPMSCALDADSERAVRLRRAFGFC